MKRRPKALPSPVETFCPVSASIEILQEKWTMHIIRRLLEDGEQGFNQLQRGVRANPATLAERLEHLEELGIVRRTVHSVMPPRTSYALTPAGVALHGVVDAIADWGRKYLDDARGRRGTVTVRRTG
jgi:DNA-binding HxlR family transcriptional regulator